MKHLFPIAYTILLLINLLFRDICLENKCLTYKNPVKDTYRFFQKNKKDDSHTIVREYKHTIHSTDITSTSTPNKPEFI